MVEQMLSHGHVTAPNDEAVAIESNVKTKTRAKKLVGFKKHADTPLGETVTHKLASRTNHPNPNLKQIRRTQTQSLSNSDPPGTLHMGHAFQQTLMDDGSDGAISTSPVRTCFGSVVPTTRASLRK